MGERDSMGRETGWARAGRRETGRGEKYDGIETGWKRQGGGRDRTGDRQDGKYRVGKSQDGSEAG